MKTAKYLIEKGIPVPPPRRQFRIYQWGDMEIGDSFFVRCELADLEHKLNSMTSSRNLAQRRLGCKYVLRTIRSKYKGRSGVRAWRIR